MKIIEYENLKKVNHRFFNDYQQVFNNIMSSGWYILGKNLEQFENSFAQYIDMKACVGVASGLDALIIALMALDLPPKSEVIVASNAYIACILSILRAGLVPVLVEPDPKHSNIDVTKIEEKITSKTKVIMPVHLYGYPCDMKAIADIANKHSLYIVEDCAQAHGATFFDNKVGTFSTLSAFSFYPTKNLGALGDAGALITNDSDLAKKCRSLRNYGSHIKYHNNDIGLNSRCDEIQAGFLSVKLPFLDDINNHKRLLASVYDKYLDERFQKPKHEKGYYGVYHIYNIYYEHRDLIREYLRENGVMTEIHYPIPPYRQKALEGLFDPSLYPLTDKMHAQNLSLPISYFHTTDDIKQVCEIMNQYLIEKVA